MRCVQRCLNSARIGQRHNSDSFAGCRVDVGLGTLLTPFPSTVDEEMCVKTTFGRGRLLQV